MKMKDFEVYQAYYCGACKQLQQSYGFAVRFLLNYDLVLLAIVADALSNDSGLDKKEACFANPIHKKMIRHNTFGLSLAADALILLSYHKACDNIADEKWPKRFGYQIAKSFLSFKYKRAMKQYPEIADCVTTQMQNQFSLEKNNCAQIDEACEPTAKMCEALFTASGNTESEKKILARLGLFAGQIVYLLDATEDYEKDKKSGSYNVFIKAGYTFSQAQAVVKQRCNMAAGEIALCYNLLPIQQNKDILDNIFFLGLPIGIAAAGIPKQKHGGTSHGQINSI